MKLTQNIEIHLGKDRQEDHDGPKSLTWNATKLS